MAFIKPGASPRRILLSMQRTKEWWRGLSKKWKLVIIIVPVMVALGVGGAAGAAGTLEYFAENPSACGKCHIMQPYVNSYYESSFIDSAHARAEQDVKCKDCHYVTLVQQTKELIAFVTGNYETPLKHNVRAQEFCAGCHPAKEITDAIGNRPNFAENPLLSYHLTVEAGKAGCRDPRAEFVQCQDCHKVHRSGVNYCASCHSWSFSAPSK